MKHTLLVISKKLQIAKIKSNIYHNYNLILIENMEEKRKETKIQIFILT